MSDITIYGVGFSPYVRKTLVLCEEKGLEYQNIPVSPRDIPAELKPHSPLNKVPFARIGGKWLADSSIICQYLEAIHPTPAMYPDDPYLRATAGWFEEFIDGGMIPKIAPKIIFQRVINPLFFGIPCDDAVVQDGIDNDLPPLLNYLEQAIGSRPFLVDDRFTIADISVAGVMVMLMHARVEIDADRWPNVMRHRDAMWRRASLAKLIEQEKHFFAALTPKAAVAAS